MPILDDLSIEYDIPDEMKAYFTKEFVTSFKSRLDVIFKITEPQTFMSFYFFVEGTSGWYNAFKHTCIEFKYEHIVSYYKQLPYYDSDLFDDHIGDLLVSYGLIEEGEVPGDEG